MIITRLLEKSIRRTEAVDREALCIIAGEKVRHESCTVSDPRCGISASRSISFLTRATFSTARCLRPWLR